MAHAFYLHAHARTVFIRSARVVDGDRSKTLVVAHVEDLVTLTLPSATAVNSREVALDIEFQWVVNGAPSGLYLGRSEGNKGGGSPPYLVTQFEPTSARKAFPCFDEPDLKAVFEVHVRPPSVDCLVLSNMPRALPQPTQQGFYAFQPTPCMSTYLLALLIAPPRTFVCTHMQETPGGTLVRVWRDADQDPPSSADVALQAAVRGIHACTHLTGVGYALPKLDLVPVHVFDSGAMENWGLLVFRRTALLVPPGREDAVRDTVVHEIAHQWFGNTITMRWWHHLWLNEAFATVCAVWIRAYWSLGFPEYCDSAWALALDSNLPTWRHFLARDLPPVLHGRAVRTLRSAVTTEASIEAQFDGATYTKGAAVLRGLFLALQSAAPRVVRAYFAAAVRNRGMANPDMLWASALTEAPEAVSTAKAALGWAGHHMREDHVDSALVACNPSFAWPVLSAGPVDIESRVQVHLSANDFGAALCLVLSAVSRVLHHADTRALQFLKTLSKSRQEVDKDLVQVAAQKLLEWRSLCRASPGSSGMTDADRRAALQVLAAKDNRGKFAVRSLLHAAVQASNGRDIDVPAWTALLGNLERRRVLADHEVQHALTDLSTRAQMRMCEVFKVGVDASSDNGMDNDDITNTNDNDNDDGEDGKDRKRHKQKQKIPKIQKIQKQK
jgi:hypothetical protein